MISYDTSVAGDLERSLLAFDEAAHASLMAGRAVAAEQRLNAALEQATEEADRELVRAIHRALDAVGLGGACRVFAVHEQRAIVWMTGDPKLRAAEVRDEVVTELRLAGLDVTMRGSWDMAVRDARRKDG